MRSRSDSTDMKPLYIILPIITFLFCMSCSEDPDALIKKGEYSRAIILLKQELSKDYQNTLLRNKITRLYFTNAERNILDNDLEEAERNIERGIIYSDETNPEIKDKYSDILVQLGAKLIESGDREGSVDLQKKYEKGVKLISKASALSSENRKAATLLDEIKTSDARSYFESAQESYNAWLNDKSDTGSLQKSLEQLELASSAYDLPGITGFRDKLKQAFLTVNIAANDHDIRILNTYYNFETGYTAFRIRFYNNSEKETTVEPSQFTLSGTDGAVYRFDVKKVKKLNYRNLMNKYVVNPDRFVTGLVVFETGSDKNPVFSSLNWSDGKGNECTKEFPDIPVTELVPE